jgi:hypothetical protein
MAENHLIKYAGESNDAFKTTIIRPAYFFPSTKYPEDAKNLRAGWERGLDWVLGGAFRATTSFGITVEEMGTFAVEAAKGTWDGKGPIFSNNDMKTCLKTLEKR